MATPMHRACESGASVEVVQELINSKCAVTLMNTGQETALHKACINNCGLEQIKALLQARANVNTVNKREENSLHLACANRNPYEVIKILVKAGADVRAINRGGMTPLMLAREKGLDHMTVMLLGKQTKKQVDNGGWPITYHYNVDVMDRARKLNATGGQPVQHESMSQTRSRPSTASSHQGGLSVSMSRSSQRSSMSRGSSRMSAMS